MNVSYSEKLGFVWYRVAKTGTRSLNRLLSEHVQDYVYVSDYEAKRGDLEIVASLVQNGAFTFSCVRNPWDRVISAWLSKIKTTAGAERVLRARPRRCQQLDNTASVDEIVNGDFAFFVERLAGSELFSKDVHFKPQSKIIAHHKLDYVARFERFESEIHGLLKKIGIAPPRQLPWKNRSTDREAYPRYYTPSTQKTVADLYASDIALYGYSFESQLKADDNFC